MKNRHTEEALKILEAFSKKRVMHLKLKELIEELSDIELPSYKGKVVVLVGPSGSGKSTALSYFARLVNESYRSEMVSNPSFIPVVHLTLPTGISGDFDWRDGFIRVLEKFNEPLINRKVIPKQQVELDGDVLTNISGMVRSDLRRAVRNCVTLRQTKSMLIDEASSLFTSSSKDKYLLQFELLKSAANDFGLPMVLCGAYDLLKIEDFNGQLIRRTRIIHFGRYRAEDVLEGTKYGHSFQDTVASLLEAIPFPKEDGLVDHAEYFLMMTAGCVGNLKDWLSRTLEAALKMEDPRITRTLLEQNAMAKRNLKKLLQESVIGERLLEDISDAELAKEMGFDSVPSLHAGAQSSGDPGAAPSIKKRNPRPGRRGPSRDVVGGAPYA